MPHQRRPSGAVTSWPALQGQAASSLPLPARSPRWRHLVAGCDEVEAAARHAHVQPVAFPAEPVTLPAIYIAGQPQPAPVSDGASTEPDLIITAAHQARDHAARAAVTGVGSGTIEQLSAQVTRLARSYVTPPPLPLFAAMHQALGQVQAALEQKTHPLQARDLNFLAGALGRMTSIQGDAATQRLYVDKETSHLGRQRLDEDPESRIDLKNLTKPLDRAIADTQSVALLCCQVLRCLSWFEMIDPPDRGVLSGRFGSGTAQQVEIVIREFLQAGDQLRQIVRLGRRGKRGAEPGSDRYRWCRRPQQLADRPTIKPGQADQFSGLDFPAALLHCNEKQAGDVGVGPG